MTWQSASFAVLAIVLLAGFAWYERRRPPAKVVALVAALAALAVVGRLAFAAIPNVKPTTDIVLFAGYALGAAPGFVVGAVTALVSNVFLGHGPWTAWQMTAWGGVGIGGALLARAAGRRELGRIGLAVACGFAGLAFGAFMDVFQWTLAARQDPATYLAVAASSLPYNLAHAVGNVVFCLLIGPAFIRALRRYRRRFEVSWPDPMPSSAGAGAGPAAAALLLCLALAVGLGASAAEAPPARAATSATTKAVRYLLGAQNSDGGFGGDRGQTSNQLHSGWAALGLAAAGRNPRDVSAARGRSLAAYLRRVSLRDTGELERTILALRAAGLPARRFRGRDLVAELVGRRRGDGSWRRNIALTAFGILALRATGERPAALERSARWLTAAQNPDGGFGFAPRAESDVDDTGAVLQALRAAGKGNTGAVGYLRRIQNRDGGFGQMQGRDSNAQSTAWAVQGLVAAGVRLESLRANPIRYLTGLQRRDGHIAYSRTSDQTPVWVTAQAITALRRRPFPLAPAPLARRPARESDSKEKPAAASARKSRAAVKKGRRRREEPDAGAGVATPASAPPSAGEPEQIDPAPASAGAPSGDERGTPPIGLVVLAAVGVLALVGLLRRRLRASPPRPG